MKMNNEQLSMNNEKIIENDIVNCYLLFVNYFTLAVFDIEMRRRRSSLQSFIILVNSLGVIRFVSFRRSNQYSVSAHSLREIFIFTMNSFLLTEYWASDRFAPMDVPERKTCFARIYSCFSSQRYL